MLVKGIAAASAVLALLGELNVKLTAVPLATRLVLSFVGYLVLLSVLAFGFLVAVSYVVDPDKEQENDDPFYRKVITLYVEALIMLLRVRVKTTGLEKTPKEGRFLLVCNHQFTADPGILLHCFKNGQLAFISKEENKDLFCVGRLMHRILCQRLNRSDDRQALQVILKCIRIIKEDKASIAVFPEGGTNHDELLHHFRPGVFKIAQKAQVPIVVCTLNNTRPIIKNAMKLKKTDVELHLLGVIPAEELKGKTAVEISDRVHAMMAEDLGPELVAED